MSATATISIEIELGWGLVNYGMLDALSDGRHRETETLSRLLELCETLDLPVTFNVVGHLCLDGPLSSYAGNYPAGWLDRIPRTGPKTDPEFYAPDMVETIQQSPIAHELATHTFTHVRCGEVTRETLGWELDHVEDVHRELTGNTPTSFVPPNHSLPPLDVLRDAGISVLRIPDFHAEGVNRPPTRGHKAGRILRGTDPLVEPTTVDGLVHSYVSEHISLATPLLPSGQLAPHPVFRLIPVSVRRRLHRRNLSKLLSRAIQQESSVHLWAHLWDFSNDEQWPQIEDFLRELAAASERGEVTVRRMKDLVQ